ncbi:M48 family metallopeptidase [Colwellia sp. MB02u-6]|uniref:M48 family metallopeptidase n=1 Tax=Colwellia sp. MB02u-6 TaxID=2759824 RepID=UPI0015F69E76|nr:M48 family metallopeptidase [Colwellia sp. MB02u-6]MBA6327883.1 M48 family metallopeptidase [Colwellia sp. MB02u-6]
MKLTLVLCLAIITVTGCTTSSTGRSQLMMMSESDLNKMGSASFKEMKSKEKISQSPKINRYVQCVANAITKNVPKSAHNGAWEVVVFDSEQVNAFALPGGKIGVYTGILKVTENQDQLGAIIGHEVGHVIEHHANERLSSNQVSQIGLSIVSGVLESQNVESRNTVMAGLGLGVQYGVLMPYGRSHESEADIVGQDLMAKSGFDPKASIKLWQNMAKLSKAAPPEFMSTHPSNATRIKQLTAHLPISTPIFKQATAPKCLQPAI